MTLNMQEQVDVDQVVIRVLAELEVVAEAAYHSESERQSPVSSLAQALSKHQGRPSRQ